MSDRLKLAALNLLNQKYGITEEDFLSAELCGCLGAHIRTCYDPKNVSELGKIEAGGGGTVALYMEKYENLGNSSQVFVLSHCSFAARYSLIAPTRPMGSIPWTAAASARDSPWAEGPPMQCMPAPIRMGIIP